MQEEISKIFLEKISGTTDLIEEKFSQLEINIQQKHDSYINDITTKNKNRIIKLENEIRTKDDEINKLNNNENELMYLYFASFHIKRMICKG